MLEALYILAYFFQFAPGDADAGTTPTSRYFEDAAHC